MSDQPKQIAPTGVQLGRLDTSGFKRQRRRKAPSTPEPTQPDQPPTSPAETVKAGPVATPDRAQTPTPKPTAPATTSPDATEGAPSPRSGAGRPRTAVGRAPEAMGQVTVYLPATLADELRVTATRLRMHHGDLIVQACVALADRAAELIGESMKQAASSGFQVTSGGTTKVQFAFRISGQNQQALDDLITASGANDRSHLITTLMAQYLTQV